MVEMSEVDSVRFGSEDSFGSAVYDKSMRAMARRSTFYSPFCDSESFGDGKVRIIEVLAGTLFDDTGRNRMPQTCDLGTEKLENRSYGTGGWTVSAATRAKLPKKRKLDEALPTGLIGGLPNYTTFWGINTPLRDTVGFAILESAPIDNGVYHDSIHGTKRGRVVSTKGNDFITLGYTGIEMGPNWGALEDEIDHMTEIPNGLFGGIFWRLSTSWNGIPNSVLKNIIKHSDIQYDK